VAIIQFANELAEAINPAAAGGSFLIALADEAKPRLAGLPKPAFPDSTTLR
jgi:hypothetical protein